MIKLISQRKDAQMLKTPTKTKVQSDVSKTELFDYLRDIYQVSRVRLTIRSL